MDPERGLVARTQTTVADAYLTPLLREHADRLAQALSGSRALMMQSSGLWVDAARFRGRDAVLSGPAGGVVALAHVARAAGAARAIGLDMGGTSTDVSRFDGEPALVYETRVAGVRLRAPSVEIHTIAAGGGSICRFDGARLTVGPESAGATPGPACYGRGGGEATLTDVGVALGRVQQDRFPFPLDLRASARALDGLAARVGASRDAVAQGCFRIAVEAMAAAIERVTVERGHDAREHALVVFGGAGGQYACAIARRLGIRKVLAHPLGGVLSALGMGMAERGWNGEAELAGARADASLRARLDAAFAGLEERARAALGPGARIRRRVALRYEGTDTSLVVDDRESALALCDSFTASHRAYFGYAREGRAVLADLARVEASAPEPRPRVEAPPGRPDARPSRVASVLFDDGPRCDAQVWMREDLGPQATLRGPALVLEATGTLVLEPGFALEVGPEGILELTDERGRALEPASRALDPVRLTIFASAFTSIAEQMGAVLQRTAVSANIRERLDFSCGLFDAEGALVANAPHIPVHLGAMGETVRAVRDAWAGAIEPGDVFASNDPAGGGSHLPDITVVSPIHDSHGSLRFWVASRGHHADVGGITPGSMPPFSSALEQEGVVLRAQRIVHRGVLDREGVLATLAAGRWPARRPLDNLADLEAQIAANRKGTVLIDELCARHGAGTVEAYMAYVQDDAARVGAQAIARRPEGERVFADALDDGAPVRARVRIAGGRMEIDLTGSAGEHDGNLNAPRAVTVAAVLYVLRALVSSPIPLNAGCLRPVSLTIPKPSLLDPSPGRAVAGGNVETSQRVVDVLLGALGVAAASQGTMNNLTFGDESFGYYETIGGGSGATREHDGESGVHTHMTNSRITDPEVLEERFPVRLVRFALRPGSGGDGHKKGGDGLVREIEALTKLHVSILSERRARAPFGLEGGGEGARGRNFHGGHEVPGRASFELEPGERLRIETPGGGGFGRA
ncbi:MAG: hydantoinase B/oxoprolinase family protein [Sandaracinaceae bacterium]|nr:hydantoinase B/oxoprolinase family protein [Sandaracinaceae bacterium]